MKYAEIAEQCGVTVGKVKMDAVRGKLDKSDPASVEAYLKRLKGDCGPDLLTTAAKTAVIETTEPLEAIEGAVGYIPRTGEVVELPTHAPAADLSINAGRKDRGAVSAVSRKVDSALAVSEVTKTPNPVKPELAERTSVPAGDPLKEGSNAWLLSKPVGFVYKGFDSFFVEVRIGADGRKELKDFPRSDNFVPASKTQQRV